MPSPRILVVLTALTVSTFLFVTTETLPIGLLPLIAGDLRASPTAVGLLVSGYGLVVVVATIPLTRAVHRLPRRPLLATLLGVFVVAVAASALAPGYGSLLAARLVTALVQAVFWAVVTPVAAGLVDAAVRGRAVSFLYAGSSLAGVLGVPAGTWIGQATSWRVAFLVLSGLGLIVLVVVAVLLPDRPAGTGGADRGSAPDAGRYRVLVVTTALAVTGAFASFTYVSPFLTDVSGLDAADVGPALLARGVAGVVGVVVVGLVVDRNPWLTTVAAVALQAVALAAQYLLGATPLTAVVAVAAGGFGLAALAAVLGARVLAVAPGSTDMAAAGTSTSFNVGITAGALLGGVLLPAAGVRSTALAGAVLTLAALAAVLAEPAIAARSRRPRACPAGAGR